MSDEAQRYVRQRSPYRGPTYLVHLALAERAEGWCSFWTVLLPEEVAREWRITIPEVEYALDELRADGLLEQNGTLLTLTVSS